MFNAFFDHEVDAREFKDKLASIGYVVITIGPTGFMDEWQIEFDKKITKKDIN